MQKLNEENVIKNPYPFRLAKRIYSGIGFAVFAMFIVTNLLTTLYTLLCELFFPSLLSSYTALAIASQIIQNVIGLGAAALVLKFIPASVIKGCADNTEFKVNVKTWFSLFAIGYMLLFFGSYIGNYVSGIFSSLLGYEVGSTALEMVSELPLWCDFLLVVIIAPISEEILFRKLLIDRLYVFGEKTAIFMSALMFAMFHGNFYQFFYALFVGALFSYVYVKTGKLYLTVTLHMALNFVGSVISGYVYDILTELMEFMQPFIDEFDSLFNEELPMSVFSSQIGNLIILLVYEVAVYALIIVGIVFACKSLKKISFRRGCLQIPKGSGFSVTFGNPGMFVFFLQTVLLFLMQMLTV